MGKTFRAGSVQTRMAPPAQRSGRIGAGPRAAALGAKYTIAEKIGASSNSFGSYHGS